MYYSKSNIIHKSIKMFSEKIETQKDTILSKEEIYKKTKKSIFRK